MANIASAKKRARQAEKNRRRNTSARSLMRTYVKKFLTAVEAGDKSTAETLYREVAANLDKTAGKGIIHKNNAARQKSRLNKHLAAMS